MAPGTTLTLVDPINDIEGHAATGSWPNAPSLRTPWTFHILPYLEGGVLANAFNYQNGINGPAYLGSTQNMTVIGTRVGTYNCPSDIPQIFLASWRPKFNYGANWGNTDLTQSALGSVNYLTAPFTFDNVVGINAVTDGTSNTLLNSELLQTRSINDERSEWWNDVDPPRSRPTSRPILPSPTLSIFIASATPGRTSLVSSAVGSYGVPIPGLAQPPIRAV